MRTKLLIAVLILAVFGLSCGVYAYSLHIYTGGYAAADAQSLKYVRSGGDYNYQTNVMTAGANAWNGISSKVNLINQSGGEKLTVIKSTSTVPDLTGQTEAYYKNILGVLTLDSNRTNTEVWTYCYLYDNQMDNQGYDTSMRAATCTHEVGHALSLAHNDDDFFSIMCSYSLHATVPQDADKYNLRQKWGN